jgi:hypothetical protein
VRITTPCSTIKQAAATTGFRLPVLFGYRALHDRQQTSPIEYMARTREWYLALGYDNPYQWAHHDERAVLGAWQTA